MCVLMFKSSHRPDGNSLLICNSTLVCTTVADGPINYSLYVLQRTLKVPIAPMGIPADLPNRISSFNSDPFFGSIRDMYVQPRLQTSHRPDGKNADALTSTLALHNWECFGQLQHVRAAETFKSSHCPDGNSC